MSTPNPKTLLLALLLGAIAGCDGASTAPLDAGDLTEVEVMALVAGFDEIGALVAGGQMAFGMGGFAASAEGSSAYAAGSSASASLSLAEPVTRTERFSATRDCPLGGSVHHEGERTMVRDRAAQSARMTLEATRELRDCAQERRNGVVITTSGEMNFTAEHYHEAGVPVGPQTQTQEGSFSWSTDSGREGSCDIDLTTVFEQDTATGVWTRTVTGTVCGRTVERTASWTRPAR